LNRHVQFSQPITKGCGSISVAVAGHACQGARAALPGLTLYDALSLAGHAGLLEVGRDGLPRALPWAKLFRPVGAWHLLLDPALKGRHIVALGNAQGTRSNRIIQALKGRNNPMPL